jgi:isopenicillin N synthase-like dioxygenase
MRNTPNFRGYRPLLSGNNNPENAGDMHESFGFGWEGLSGEENGEKRSNDGVMAGANIWPMEVPKFREALLSY